MKRTTLIGIAGGSASGKTTVAEALAAHLGPAGAVLLSHDRYYRPLRPGVDPSSVNFDAPESLDNDLFAAHLQALRAGMSVDVPEYDFASCARIGRRRLEPAPVIIVEGILLFAVSEVVGLLDHRIFVDTPEDERLFRRITRDSQRRGRDLRAILRQYFATVRPMHERFVAPSRLVAEMVVDGTRPVDAIVDACLGHLRGQDPEGAWTALP